MARKHWPEIISQKTLARKTLARKVFGTVKPDIYKLFFETAKTLLLLLGFLLSSRRFELKVTLRNVISLLMPGSLLLPDSTVQAFCIHTFGEHAYSLQTLTKHF